MEPLDRFIVASVPRLVNNESLDAVKLSTAHVFHGQPGGKRYQRQRRREHDMSTTTAQTPTAIAPFNVNTAHRAYISAHGGNYPAQIRYSGRVYTKEQGVGTPEYYTSTRNNWLAGVRAVELIGTGQAHEVTK